MSVSGTAMQQVAQDWLLVQLTGRAFAVAIASVLQFLPVLLLGIWGGAIADRVDKRRLLITTQAVLGTLAFILAVLALTDVLNVWLLYALAALLGCATAFDMPARQSFVSEIVAPDRLVNAVALNNGALNAARVIGPAVAGVLLSTVGAAAAFLLNALSYLAVIASLQRMDRAQLQPAPPCAHERHPVRDGLAYVRSSAALRTTMLLMAVVAAVGPNLQVILPVLARYTFHGNAGLFATLMAVVAAGSVLGALVAGSRNWPSVRLQLVGAVGFAAVTVLASLMATASAVTAVLFFVGMASTSVLSLANSFVQLHAPPEMRGRVMAINGLLYRTALMGGALVLGWLADRFDPRTSLGIAGAVSLAFLLAVAMARTGDAIAAHARVWRDRDSRGRRRLPGREE